MICRDEIERRGVFPSEQIVPYGALFDRLERYGVTARDA
jgi:hypothetical protein